MEKKLAYLAVLGTGPGSYVAAVIACNTYKQVKYKCSNKTYYIWRQS